MLKKRQIIQKKHEQRTPQAITKKKKNELQNQIDGRSGSGFEYTHAQLETIIQFTSLETDR